MFYYILESQKKFCFGTEEHYWCITMEHVDGHPPPERKCYNVTYQLCELEIVSHSSLDPNKKRNSELHPVDLEINRV